MAWVSYSQLMVYVNDLRCKKYFETMASVTPWKKTHTQIWSSEDIWVQFAHSAVKEPSHPLHSENFDWVRLSNYSARKNCKPIKSFWPTKSASLGSRWRCLGVFVSAVCKNMQNNKVITRQREQNGTSSTPISSADVWISDLNVSFSFQLTVITNATVIWFISWWFAVLSFEVR